MSDAIDPVTFANLVEMTGGEMDFVDELVDTFLEDGRNQVDALQAALAGGEAEALVRPAHSLKTGSLSVGALRLGELCRALEEDARRPGAVADAADRVAEIRTALAAAAEALLRARSDRQAG